MKLSMDSFQALLIDMGINLRRGDIGVTEHFLDDAQVGAVAQQMRRKTVPQQMRVNIFFQSGMSRDFFHDLPDAPCG